MKNLKYIIIFGILALIVGIIIFFNTNNKSSVSENNNTQISRTSTQDNTQDNSNEDSKKTENNSEHTEQNKSQQEELISEFSTKIYTTNDPARQSNLELTASKLNETIVQVGQTFSFTSTVGKATPEEGYQKADIFDADGNKIKGYGGGNCQISSTLYNAVLNLPSLSVIERHPHSHKVPYIQSGKDAAVAYGSIDFKFVNNYDFNIKIYCSVDKQNVYINIFKLY